MFQTLDVSQEHDWEQKEWYMIILYQYLSSILLIQFCILMQVTFNLANNYKRIYLLEAKYFEIVWNGLYLV